MKNRLLIVGTIFFMFALHAGPDTGTHVPEIRLTVHDAQTTAPLLHNRHEVNTENQERPLLLGLQRYLPRRIPTLFCVGTTWAAFTYGLLSQP